MRVLDIGMITTGAFQVAPVVKNLPANAGDVRDAGSTPGSRRFPGGGYSNPLQCSFLENLIDREAWQATVHGVSRIGHELATKPPPGLIEKLAF